MGLLDQVTKGRLSRPRRTVLYGPHGIGKSTWAACWPDAIFLPTEDGTADIDCARFPLLECLGSYQEAVAELAQGEHQFRSAVTDSADWLEQLIQRHVCETRGVGAITDIDFGKGYGAAAAFFREVLDAMNVLVGRGMHVVFVAHAKQAKIEPPGQNSFTRYEPKLHRSNGNGPSVCEMLQEWADEVLFCNYRVDVKTEKQAFNRERGIGIGGGERVLYTCERPAHLAKNRLGLPPELPLDFSAYEPWLNGTAQSGAA